MARITTRAKDKNRTRTPSFPFHVRALKGEPTRDSDAVRAEKEKLVAEFAAKNGVLRVVKKSGEFKQRRVREGS